MAKKQPVVEPRSDRCYPSKECNLQVLLSEKKPNLICIRGTLRRESPQSYNDKNVENAIFENFWTQTGSNYSQTNKEFWQSIRSLRGKRSDIDRSKWCHTQQREECHWQMERVLQRSYEPSYYHIVAHTAWGAFGGGKYHCQNTEGWEDCRLGWNSTWNAHRKGYSGCLVCVKWNGVPGEGTERFANGVDHPHVRQDK